MEPKDDREPAIHPNTPEGIAARKELADKDAAEREARKSDPLARGIHPDSGPDSLQDAWEDRNEGDRQG